MDANPSNNSAKGRPRRRKLILVIIAAVVCVLAVFAADAIEDLWAKKPLYGCPIGGPAATRVDDSSYTFAYMGDTRWDSGIPERGAVLDRAIRGAITAGCKFGIHGGDLVDSPSDANFEGFCGAVWQATGGKFPVYPVAGNHDVRDAAERWDSEYKEFLGPKDYVFWYGRDAFVVTDTSGDGFDAEQGLKLDNTLTIVRPRARNIFLITHVPPFDPDPAGSHCLGPGQSARLMEIAAKHGVTMLFCGHIHGYATRTIGGVPVVISGGTGAPLAVNAHYNWTKVSVNGTAVSVEQMIVE